MDFAIDHLLTLAFMYLVYYIGLYAGKRQGRRHERAAINSVLSRFETSLTVLGRRYAVGPTLQTLQYLRTEFNRCPDTKNTATTQDKK